MSDLNSSRGAESNGTAPVGDGPHRRPIVKQYGEKRTGTNLLRLLLSSNVPDIVVLMHILGDKHSPPAPFGRIWRGCQGSADPDGDFVREATFGIPAEYTHPDKPEQQDLLRRLAGPVAEAYRSERLGFLISIKSPYAWAVSLARYEGWSDRPPWGSGRACVPRLRDACRLFNLNYAAWLELHDAQPDQTSIIRYEDLAIDPSGVFERLGRQHGWPRAEGRLALPTGEVPPTTWDDDPTVERPRPFQGHGPASSDPASLPAAFRDLISDTIDWGLMRRFGYECWSGPVNASG